MSGEIQGGDVYLCRGKTIKDVIAGDPLGYNVDFTIEFTDGTKLEVSAYALAKDIEGRMNIRLKDR